MTQLLNAAAQAGKLDITDPAQAAEQLIGLWQGITNFQLALDIDSEQIRATIASRVDAGLRVFLTAYALKATKDK